jgi:hypothetical protein
LESDWFGFSRNPPPWEEDSCLVFSANRKIERKEKEKRKRHRARIPSLGGGFLEKPNQPGPLYS